MYFVKNTVSSYSSFFTKVREYEVFKNSDGYWEYTLGSMKAPYTSDNLWAFWWNGNIQTEAMQTDSNEYSVSFSVTGVIPFIKDNPNKYYRYSSGGTSSQNNSRYYSFSGEITQGNAYTSVTSFTPIQVRVYFETNEVSVVFNSSGSTYLKERNNMYMNYGPTMLFSSVPVTATKEYT